MDRVQGEHGIKRDNRQGRLEFACRMETLREENADVPHYGQIRRGWRFGSVKFVAQILDRIEGKLGESQTRREQEESMEQRAQRIVDEGLREAGWSEQDLAKERKGHPLKVEIASRLRQETTMSLKWIAENLRMGAWTYVSFLLHRHTK